MTASRDRNYCEGVAEILDMLPDRVIRYRLADHTITYCNAAWAAGHGLTAAEAIGLTIDELLTEDEMAGLASQLALLGPANTIVADDVPRAAPNAPGEWVEWVDRYLPGSDGDEDAEVLAVGRDVTGRHTAESNLAASEARFRELADGSADIVWRFVSRPDPHFDYMSPSVEHLLGNPPSFFLEDFTRFLDTIDDEGRAMIRRAYEGHPMPARYDMHFRRADGSIRIGEVQTTTFPGGLQGVTRDVTEFRHLQEQLADLALHDPLTGLANRRLLDELLKSSLARTQRSGTPLAVAFLDLDGVKTVNDTYGHDAGDTVLRETARRLLSIVRSSDVVARIGGDEFVIVYEPCDPRSDNLISRLDSALSSPIDLTAIIRVCCPASIGCADTRTVGRDPAALLAAADAAMYGVKKSRDRSAGPAAPSLIPSIAT